MDDIFQAADEAITSITDVISDSTSHAEPECQCSLDPSFKRCKNHPSYFPYLSIYEKKDECRNNGYLLRGVPIDIRIDKVKEDPAPRTWFSDPVSYIIKIKHGPHEWQDEKRWLDFVVLSKRLKAHRLRHRLTRPFKRRKKCNKGKNNGATYGVRHRRGCPYRWSIDSDDFDPSKGLNVTDVTKKHQLEPLPKFPNVPKDRPTERKIQLESWIRHVIEMPDVQTFNETTKFLDISRFSFVKGIGKKDHEGVVRKRLAVGGEVYMDCSQMFLHYFIPKTKRWLIVKDSCLFYYDLRKENIRLVILMDEKFKVKPRDLGLAGFSSTEFALINEDYKIYIKTNRKEDAVQFKLAIRNCIQSTGAIWLEHKRFNSTYPFRTQENYSQTFVDGCDYWSRAADIMEMAREEIFIGHWWLSPEMYLKKPIHHGSKWRLDHILKRAAERGVRVFVLLFKEFSQGMVSEYCKRTLQGLHPNIKVIRHPDHKPCAGVFLWTHHEKFLVVDQLIAFVGGIDFTYGRWDNYKHVLGDLGFVDVLGRLKKEIKEEKAENVAIRGRNDMEVIEKGLVSAVKAAVTAILADSKLPELKKNKSKPQRRIELKYLTLNGEEVEKDVFLLKFCDYSKLKLSKLTGIKNLIEEELSEAVVIQSDGINEDMNFVNEKEPFIKPKKPSSDEDLKAQISLATKMISNKVIESYHASIPSETDLVRVAVLNPNPYEIHESTTKFWGGGTHSYNSNPLRRFYENLMIRFKRLRFKPEAKTIEEYVINLYIIEKQQTTIERKENAGKVFPGKDYVNFIHKDIVDADDAFSDFTDRYNVCRMPWHDSQSATYGEAARDVARHFLQRWNAAKREKLRSNDAYPYLIPKSYDNIRVPSTLIMDDMFKTEVQVLRSVTRWSAMTDKTEDSIHQAYISLISNAKHYVYIENQFFVSMINNADVSNEITQSICERIIRAHREGETFRVYIMLPLLPAMEADIKKDQQQVIFTMLHFLYASLSRGDYSLMGYLKENGVEDPFKYLCFTSMRTHDELAGKLITELVYIHSKFMIVDDMHVINSSANINDRSLVGDRDSELALCITDTEFVKSKMNGEEYMAGKHALALRMRCMKEHLGLLPNMIAPGDENIDLSDPTSDSFWNGIWRRTAESNTKVYDEVFKALPSDEVKSIKDMDQRVKETPMAITDPEKAKQRMKNLKGHLVQFPLHFLEDESFVPTNFPLAPQGYAPTALFV